jgi:hypothetical protein
MTIGNVCPRTSAIESSSVMMSSGESVRTTERG